MKIRISSINNLTLRTIIPSILISITTLIVPSLLITGLNQYLIFTIITFIIIFTTFCQLISSIFKRIIDNFIFIKLNYVLIFTAIIYYGSVFLQQIITILNSKSLYYLTVNNVIPEKSTFISRIFTYFIPESIYIVLFSFLLISLIQLKKYKSLLFAFKSEKEFYFYKNLLLITFGIQTISRFMSASLSGIISLLIITYTILVYYTDFSIGFLFLSIYKYIQNLLVRYKLKSRFIFFTLLITLFTSAIGYVSNNRGGDFTYLVRLIPEYIKQTYIYSYDIFNYFLTGEPAKCGLQSNILYYFFDPKPVSICLQSYKNTLFDSGLFRDGAWVGLLGAHAIDFGSNMVILSIIITLAIYYFLTKFIINISFLKTIRPIISIILIIYFSLTLAFLFTGFITANYIMIGLSVFNIIILRMFSLIKIYQFDPNN